MKLVQEYFGSMVFDDRVMKANLPSDVYKSLRRTIERGARISHVLPSDESGFAHRYAENAKKEENARIEGSVS